MSKLYNEHMNCKCKVKNPKFTGWKVMALLLFCCGVEDRGQRGAQMWLCQETQFSGRLQILIFSTLEVGLNLRSIS